MQNGEQLGTDPPPSLAKKKSEITKKNYQKRNRSQQKTAEPKQGNTEHVTDTHKKVSSHKVSNKKKWSIKNSNSVRIAETQKEGLNRE